MQKATYTEKERIIHILSKSFDDNQSINYIVKQDKNRERRIRALVDYSIDVCRYFGEVFISEDKDACALILYPGRKKTTLKTIFLDIQLILQCVGFGNIKKTLRRESLIKRKQPRVPMTYIWFIGVDPVQQNKGKGSLLLESILEESKQMKRMVCLETSTLKNLPWYQKFGFKIYHEEDLGYKLYFLSYTPD